MSKLSTTTPTKRLSSRKAHIMVTTMKYSATAGLLSLWLGRSSPRVTASTTVYMMSGHISPDETSKTVISALPTSSKCAPTGAQLRETTHDLPEAQNFEVLPASNWQYAYLAHSCCSSASFSSAHHEGPMSALCTAALSRVIVPVHSFAWRPGAALLREQPVPSG